MPWVWIGLGGLIGLVNGVSQVWLVSRIHPDVSFNVRGRVFRSYGVRFVLIAVGLALAVRSGLEAAVGMFCGIWLTRWIPVLLGCTSTIDWSWFDIASKGVG